MSLSKAAMLEISDLSHEAEQLARGSASDRKRADILVQRIANIRQCGLSSDEIRKQLGEALNDDVNPTRNHTPISHPAEYRARFDRYLAGHVNGERELRDFLAGTQSLTYTTGAQGGFIVPMDYDNTLREAMAQTDPLLDAEVCDFTMTPGPTLQPGRASGYDLSTVAAAVIGEGTQQTAQTIPTVAGKQLRSDLIFKVTFGATMEAEQDIADFAAKIVRAVGVALARKVGQSVVAGAGGTDISSVTVPIPIGAVQLQAGKLQLGDITNLFFAVNRYYRASAKCAWLADDASYKKLRNAVDSSNRPLLSVEDSQEMLMGKPVYVVPSLATSNLFSIGVAGGLVFGDLSAIIVRTSRPTLVRTIEASIADITQGKAAYIARWRADAAFFDPSNGSNSPLQKMLVS